MAADRFKKVAFPSSSSKTMRSLTESNILLTPDSESSKLRRCLSKAKEDSSSCSQKEDSSGSLHLGNGVRGFWQASSSIRLAEADMTDPKEERK